MMCYGTSIADANQLPLSRLQGIVSLTRVGVARAKDLSLTV